MSYAKIGLKLGLGFVSASSAGKNKVTNRSDLGVRIGQCAKIRYQIGLGSPVGFVGTQKHILKQVEGRSDGSWIISPGSLVLDHLS